MKMKNLFIGASIILLFVIGWSNNNDAYADSLVGNIEFSNCKVSDSADIREYKAECATLEVPEDYAKPEGKKISIAIARFKAKGESNDKDAISLIAGGPGQGSVSTFAPMISALNSLNSSRDIYLIDQRGTGKSNPLNCPESDQTILEINADTIKNETRKCLQQLESDTRFYNTSNAVKDLDAIRTALGFEQWNLYGGSYGSRVALHYLRQYPEYSRTIVLDGVAPPDWDLGTAMAIDRQAVFEQMFIRCEQHDTCHKAYPELRENTLDLIKSLRTSPAEIEFENINTGKIDRMTYTHHHLIGIISMYTYSPVSTSILPVMLHEAAVNNNFSPLARQAASMGDNPMSLSMGMMLSAICTEDAPFYTSDEINNAELQKTIYKQDIVNQMHFSCEIWPEGVRDDNFKQPVVADNPVLILSGSIDPVTPPANGEQVKQTLTNSKHIINEGQGHIQLTVGCMPKIVTKFIENASVADLETDCLQQIKTDPFFVNINGPVSGDMKEKE